MVLRHSCVLAAAVLFASAPAVGQDLEAASSLDYAEVLEGRDGAALSGAELAEVGDDHPLIKRARLANPGREVVVCMAGCSREPGGAVFADTAAATKTRKTDRVGSSTASSAPPVPRAEAPAAIPAPAVAAAVQGANSPAPVSASEAGSASSRLSAISLSAAGLKPTRDRKSD